MLLWIVIWFGSIGTSDSLLGWNIPINQIIDSNGVITTSIKPTNIYDNLLGFIFNNGNDTILNPIIQNGSIQNYGTANDAIAWGGFTLSIIYSIIVTIFLGLLIVSIGKSPGHVQSMGTTLFFFSMFLSGQLFPMSSIVAVEPLNVISYFTPYRYITGLCNMSWSGANVFDMSQTFYEGGFGGIAQATYFNYDMWLNWFIPITVICLSLYATVKIFKWHVR